MNEQYSVPSNSKGEIAIFLHKGEYGSENMEVIKEEKMKNLIVNKASELMALLMKPANGSQKGIEYLAVGTGFGTGSQTTPQAEAATQTALRTELARKAITSNTVSANVLTLTTTFNETEAVGALVEMGLFGGTTASATSGTGYMFNYKVFSVWNKPNDAKLTIVWTITF